MKCAVEKGKTLLVDGPASLSLLSGEARVLGAPFKIGDKIVIREGKRIPFEVNKKATFDLKLGENASFEKVEGSTIPPSWEKASKEIVSHEKPVTVMVMGGVDSGKTSFCAYLANKALEAKRKVAIIDGDLGQSDIGPPSTIGFSHITKPIRDLFEIEAENAYFVGLTSPSQAINKVIEGLATLKTKVSETKADFLIVNTDGWIDGEDALRYKVWLTERVTPDIVIGIQQTDELMSILTALKETRVVAIESSPATRKRDREKRKTLRELSYKKYLKEAKVRSFPLNIFRVEDNPFGTRISPKQMEKLRELLGTNPIHCEGTSTAIFIVLKKNQLVNEDHIEKIEESLGKKVRLVIEGEEEGLLVALKDARGNFLGIGVLFGIDYERGAMKIYTSVGEKVSTIHAGQVKLEKDGREIGLSPVFTEKI